MKTFSLLKRALTALLFLLISAPAFAQFKVIGYLPSWTGNVGDVQFSKVTHVNYAFLLPTSTGGLQPIENPTKLQSLVSTAHANGVKVIISVGGWLDGNPGVFVSIGNNAGYTSTFATNLVNFVNQYNLDGVDIDWEHPDANTANGYASVMQQLATQLHSRGKLLTTAVAGGTWAGPYIQSSVLSNVDFLNVMAYDDTAPAHSTYALASQSLTYWRGRGLPATKLVLGVPFYGQPSGETFAALVARGADPNADLFNGVGYNGIPTIKSKTNLAFDQGGGIMIWHLGGDAAGGNSLLTAINQVVVARTGVTPPSPQAIPGTIQAESFTTQSGTQTEVTTDTGGGRNVDYFETGDWLDYSVNVATAGTYTVGFRVASANGGATLQLRNSSGGVLGSINVGNTGGWQTWQTINATITLPAGTQTLRLHAAASTGCNVNWLSFATVGTSFSRQLEAEAANVNNGMTAEACTDAGGGQNMGYVDAGDYLVWNGINFPTTGIYLIEYRVSSGASGGTISSDLNAGTTQLGNTTIPATGGWQNWTTVSRSVAINAGTYNFGVYAQTGGWNLNWVRISKAAGARMAAPASDDKSLNIAPATKLELYPNPVTDQLQLRSEQSLTGSQYQILDSFGHAVAKGAGTASSVDVSALKPGIYTFILTTGQQEQVVQRFVK